MFYSDHFDIHSIIHFVGCYALVATIIELFSTPAWLAACITLILCVLWEVADEWNWFHGTHIKFLDSRGADILDIFTDLAGILLAVWVF